MNHPQATIAGLSVLGRPAPPKGCRVPQHVDQLAAGAGGAIPAQAAAEVSLRRDVGPPQPGSPAEGFSTLLALSIFGWANRKKSK